MGLVVLASNADDSPAAIRHGREALRLISSASKGSSEMQDRLRFVVALHGASDEAGRDGARRDFAATKKSYLERHAQRSAEVFNCSIYEIMLLYRCEDEQCVELVRELCEAEKADGHCDDTRIIDVELAAATCFRAFGRVEEARQVLEEILMKSRGQDDESRSSRSSALFQLAGIYARQGNREDAEQSYRETIELSEAIRGADDPRTIIRRRELEAYQNGKLPSFAPKDSPWTVVLSYGDE
ncbi:MAG: tetratricopeptide repeat protein [Pirellulales bacterium]